MGFEQAETEYYKLKVLLESLEAITANAKANMNLSDAELTLKVNSAKEEALNELEGSLRNARLTILGSLHSTMHRFL